MRMPKVYEGHDDYVFVSYAHADRDVALPIIRALVAEGYRVWYDDGVQKGSKYPDYIADHVYRCSRFVALLSESSKASEWCDQEVHFALDLHRQVLPVYLDEVELDLGLRMRLVTTQAMYWHRYDSESDFLSDLFGVKMLDCCLTDEGRRRRGVKPRSAGVATDQGVASKTVIVQVEKPGGASGVAKRDGLADYSWTELKELSCMIAAAGSDDAGLAIAKAYRLVDKDGKLVGDEKPLALKDGTKTSVRILGFRHDKLASGGVAGISFEFADVPVTHRMNPTDTNAGGWERSKMRVWLNGEFFALLSDDLRANIAKVKKWTNNVGEVLREDDTSVVTETTDRLWLPSAYEVYGDMPSWVYSSATYVAEGNQYQLYIDHDVSTASYGYCVKGGMNPWWWLRSPYSYVSVGFHHVYYDGGCSADTASHELGVSPGFCF